MKVGVGYSEIPDSAAAGRIAAEQAQAEAGRQEPCDLALLFCTARHDEKTLRTAVADAIGQGIPIYGGGTVGVITNDTFGYAGDQVGVACIWLDGAGCEALVEGGLPDGEEQTGIRLGERLKARGVTPDSSMMLFYDAVQGSGADMRLVMATWLLAGLEKGLGFLPELTGAGLQGDHICSPVEQFAGDGLVSSAAMALAFSDEIRIDSAIMHGCRPASAYFTVTKAEGPMILEINGQPAIAFMDAFLGGSITPEQYPFFLLFGINHGEKWGEYDENNYASRLCMGIDKQRGGIIMFEPDMVEGTRFQLMFRSLDLDYMKPKIEALFEGLGGREPVFAMYIDCAGRCAGYGGVDIEDAVVLQQTVAGRVPLLGLYTGVEIAPMGGRPRGLDWTGVFCLFSRAKGEDGAKKAARNRAETWETTSLASDADAISVEGVLRLCEQNAAKILALDTQSIAIRHELEQKRRGFSLLSELAVSLRQEVDYIDVFISAAQRINAALNMQKTTVLVRDGQGKYIPVVLQGYTEEEKGRMADRAIAVTPQMLDSERPLLITGADDPSHMAQLRAALNLPFLIASPVLVRDKVEAILITGRMSEQPPFLSRLGRGDIETVQAISALLASVLVRHHLDEAEQRAHLMLDATPLCANFWDETMRNIDCNQEAVNLFNLSSKQEYLDRFVELSPEFQPDGRRSAEASVERIQQAFREGRCVFEWMHQRLDGELIPSEITLVRMRYKDRDVVIGYTRDLREIKATLSAMEKTQEELRQARDRAEESARAKSNFLANMSHEIRTPMNAIIGMAEIARGSDDMERIKYCLNKIDDASGHLLGIINDILDMSKIDAGKFTLSATDFSLEDMLQRVANVINFKVEEKRQSFVIRVDKDVPTAIIADQQRLSQVITNLLSNAVKFTPEEGEIRLLLHKVAEQGDECTLHFEVVDTGIGISREQQSKLFQSFQQADGSISRRFGGTGLGLAISKDIVRMMGGRIWLESKIDEGSRFQFTIQVKKGRAGRSRANAQSIDWKNVRILVVDDEEVVREYFEDIAANIGMACRTAKDAKEACEILAEDSDFQVIFVDWKMPGMDGIELTKLIRDRYGDQVVVVMISAAAWVQIEEQAIAAGVNRFIAKPLLPSPIVDCITECIGTAAQEQPDEEISPRETGGIFEGKHILLAEDIEINREILMALLEDTGVTIECAENGRVACDMFRANPGRYDLIFMDIHMPEMDGYQATRAIRAMDLPSAKTIPIVAMTANVFKEDIENCLAAGMNDHVGKPLDIAEVLQKVELYI